MAIQNINRGVTPNDETGDTARAAALKINENFAYLLDQITSGYQGALSISDTPTADGFYTPTEAGTYSNAGGLVYDPEDTDKGYSVHFIKSGIDWTKNRVLLYIAVTGLIESGNVEAVSGDKINTALSNKANLVVGKNMFDKSSAFEGFQVNPSTGILNEQALKVASEFIKVEPLTNYTTTATQTAFAFYDINKNVISGGAYNTKSFTTSASCEYVRIATNLSQKDLYQMELGSVSTFYEPYEKVIPSNELDLSLYVKTLEVKEGIKEEISTFTNESANLFDESKATLDYFL